MKQLESDIELKLELIAVGLLMISLAFISFEFALHFALLFRPVIYYATLLICLITIPTVLWILLRLFFNRSHKDLRTKREMILICILFAALLILLEIRLII